MFIPSDIYICYKRNSQKSEVQDLLQLPNLLKEGVRGILEQFLKDPAEGTSAQPQQPGQPIGPQNNVFVDSNQECLHKECSFLDLEAWAYFPGEIF